jgi:thymidylate kinase
VDPKRYRYGGPMWLAQLWSRTLPQPDHLIFLDADVEVLLSRKQEVSAAALKRSRAGYLQLVKRRQGTVVDVDRKLEGIVADVLLLINKA